MKRIFLLSGIVFLIGCQGQKQLMKKDHAHRDFVRMKYLKANMEFLASDELEGRETGTNGERVASAFIASELKKYGVETYFPQGQYYQPLSLRNIRFNKDSYTHLVNQNGEIIRDFEYGDHFVGSNRYYEHVDTTTSLVFVGYGITAEEYNYDDYKNLDVRNKIVLIYYGEPESGDSTYFEGEKRSLYASIFRKIENAKLQGALGVISVSGWEQRFGWESIVSYVQKGRYKLINTPVTPGLRSYPTTIISENSFKDLLSHGLYSYKELESYIDQGKSPQPFEFEHQVRVKWQFDTTGTAQVRNVIGVVPGSDPQLRDEFVSIGAHFDHEGVGPAGVFNGADDNASGTVAVLELARTFAQTKQNRRSVMFMFHTAEEKGLLGSKYMAANLDNLDQMIAHVNLDMIGRESADTVYSIGSDRLSAELGQLVEEINKKGVRMYLDRALDAADDPQRLYYRSDHYNFAKNNIPVVFFFDNHKEDYHRVTDDAEKINYQKISNIVQLVYDITVEAANRDKRLELNAATE